MKPHLLIFLSLALTGAFASAAPTTIASIQAELRALQFDKAIELANQAITAQDENADHALFLKATAEFQGKKFAEAVTTTDRIITEFPQSDWKHKAVFLKAQAFIEQKKFTEAAAIYQSESARILSPGIWHLVEKTMQAHDRQAADELEPILAADQWAREFATKKIMH